MNSSMRLIEQYLAVKTCRNIYTQTYKIDQLFMGVLLEDQKYRQQCKKKVRCKKNSAAADGAAPVIRITRTAYAVQ